MPGSLRSRAQVVPPAVRLQRQQALLRPSVPPSCTAASVYERRGGARGVATRTAAAVRRGRSNRLRSGLRSSCRRL
jgi:hypothetical protein